MSRPWEHEAIANLVLPRDGKIRGREVTEVIVDEFYGMTAITPRRHMTATEVTLWVLAAVVVQLPLIAVYALCA